MAAAFSKIMGNLRKTGVELKAELLDGEDRLSPQVGRQLFSWAERGEGLTPVAQTADGVNASDGHFAWKQKKMAIRIKAIRIRFQYFSIFGLKLGFSTLGSTIVPTKFWPNVTAIQGRIINDEISCSKKGLLLMNVSAQGTQLLQYPQHWWRLTFFYGNNCKHDVRFKKTRVFQVFRLF